MSKIKFKLITPERVVLEDEVDSVTLPAKEGEITVLPNHIPLVSILSTGVITLRKDKEEIDIASSGGFVEVLPDSQVVVLADTAETAEELTIEKVEEAKKRAEEILQEKRYSDEAGQAAALGSLERELARLKAITKKRHREKSFRVDAE